MRVPERLRDIQKMIYFPRTHIPEICHAVEAVQKSPFNNQVLGGLFELDHKELTAVDYQKQKKMPKERLEKLPLPKKNN